MATKKVVLNGETLIDLTLDTIKPEYVVEGKTFHGSDGEIYSGTYSGSNIELNVAYGGQPPTDTSKLWIKTNKPVHKVVTGEEEVENIGSLLQPADSISCAIVGEKAYLFGGRVQSNVYSSDIQSFDLKTHKTLKVGSIESIYPEGVYGLSCAAIEEKIYGFGGAESSSATSQAIYCFNTKTGTVTLLDQTYPTTASSYMGCAAVGNRIYLFGGTKGTGTNSVISDAIHYFDINTKTWKTLKATLPQPTYAMGCIAIERKIYLFGGIAPGTPSLSRLDSILCFDTDSETFVDLSATLPVKLSHVACGIIGQKIYVFGGYITSNNENFSNGYSDKIIGFDYNTRKVELQEQTLPSTMECIGSVSASSGIYLFGGKMAPRFDTIIRFWETEQNYLAEGTINIIGGPNRRKFFIINTESAGISASVSKVYYGNENNVAELVAAALYEDGNWKNIY